MLGGFFALGVAAGGLAIAGGQSILDREPPPDTPAGELAELAIEVPTLTLALVALFGLALCIGTYLVLSELQAQTQAILGPKAWGVQTVTQPPAGQPVDRRDTETERPVGSELSVGRGDSWS